MVQWISGDTVNNGNYTIEEKIGKGGFGVTYTAQNQNQEKVVIKTICEDALSSLGADKCREDFSREVRLLRRCNNAHIVRIIDDFNEDDLPCMVQEYIDGQDFQKKIFEKIVNGDLPFRESEALRYIQQIGEGLKNVHESGTLHRDVKPGNIMLRSSQEDSLDEAILIDFGLAREFVPDVTLTHTGFSSDGYTPIEQYERRAKRGEYTDVYALAATLYSLLTLKKPIPSFFRNLRGTDSLEAPQELNPDISNVVNQAIIWGMQLLPEDRPQSIQDWLQALFSEEVESLPSSPVLARSVDQEYQRLQKLLNEEKWLEANQETVALMLNACNINNRRFLRAQDIANISCDCLSTINHLWSDSSNGHFGFVMQRNIWHDAGSPEDFNLEAWRKFSKNVGWFSGTTPETGPIIRRRVSQANSVEELPPGYLPNLSGVLELETLGWLEGINFYIDQIGDYFNSNRFFLANLFSRVDQCRL